MTLAQIYQTVTAHLYDFMIPVCALYVLRIAVCLAELDHMRRLREKKGAYHGVAKHYAEIGCMACMLVFGILTCLLPKLWPGPFAVMVAAGFFGWRLGMRRGEAADDHWRAEAEALREKGAAPQAIDSGYNGLLDTLDVYDDDHAATAAQQENKGER